MVAIPVDGTLPYAIPVNDGIHIQKKKRRKSNEYVGVSYGIVHQELQRLAYADSTVRKAWLGRSSKETYVCSVEKIEKAEDVVSYQVKLRKEHHRSTISYMENSIMWNLKFYPNEEVYYKPVPCGILVHVCVPIFKTDMNKTILHPICTFEPHVNPYGKENEELTKQDIVAMELQCKRFALEFLANDL